MENQPKKSRALIITIVLILLIVLLGYLIFKNKDIFGVKTSTTISKIFSPLITSNNSKDLNKIDAQAGEDLKKGDSVSVFGTSANNNPIVVKTSTNGGEIYGYANQDIESGDTGEIVLDNRNVNDFWNSFSDFVDDLFNDNSNNNNQCTNGATNYPLCTTVNEQCINGADNFPLCTTINGQCQNGAVNPPLCTQDENSCINGTDNYPLCTTTGGECQNGAVNPPECTNNGEQCLNGADNFPLCTTIDGQCMNGATNPPGCTDNIYQCNDDNDNDNDNLIDELDPNCHINGDIDKLYIPTHYSESINPEKGVEPDLVAGKVSPISTTINTETTLSSIITNNGKSGTGHSFSVLFSISKNGGVQLYANPVETVITIPTLESKISNIATVKYIFTEIGMYSIRACADKNSASDIGTVTESIEDNNCSEYITLNVTSTLPSPGTPPQCSDTLDNDGDGKIDIADPNCHIDDGSLTGGVYMPDHDSESTSPIDPNTDTPECSDGIDNDGDDLIDRNDPVCHLNEDLTQEYQPNHSTESSLIPNMCLDIDANPLVFTTEEKAKLAELLRKFYLLASTLKTQDDIDITYSVTSQYKNFSNYIGVLVNQCYSEGIDKNGSVNPYYEGPTLRWGNPWHKYNTDRGTYINKVDNGETFVGFDCKYVSGWFTGRGSVTGDDCNIYNELIYNPDMGGVKPFCTSQLYFNDNPDYANADDSVRATGYQQIKYSYAKDIEKCVWNNGVDIDNLETILNVW